MSLSEQEQIICNQIDTLKDKSVTMLGDLVAFDSQIGREHDAQRYMARAFSQMDMEVDQFEIDHKLIRSLPGYSPALVDYSGRENVVGIYTAESSEQSGKSLILNGHIDVVPTGPLDKWRSPPFQARIQGDRLYGRGSGDMKAGIVAYTMAFDAIRRSGYKPAADIYLQSVIEEECTGNGALACLQRGYRADAAIIPEPFGQKMMNAQLGVMWFKLHVSGHPAHVLNTAAGINAIEAAYYIFENLKVLEAQWNLPENKHPQFDEQAHPVNFNLGQIYGGDWTSTVPTECEMDIRIGFFPDIGLGDIKSDIEATVTHAVEHHPQADKLDFEIRYQGFQAEGFSADLSEPLFEELANVHKSISSRQIELMASTATTDARFFHLYGDTPATCYGPIAENYHSFDEWVSISSMIEVTKVLAVFISRWCGLR